MELKGSQLRIEVQNEAKNRFTQRFTAEHTPAWAKKPMPNGNAYPVQFASDAEWLENTTFVVNTDGTLSRKVRSCDSSPTWPNNPELRK